MNIGIVQWEEFDGISDAFAFELMHLGHLPVKFLHTDDFPVGLDFILTYGPYNRFYPIAKKMGNLPKIKRPIFIHWSIENIPDPRLPNFFVNIFSHFRTTIDRMQDSDHSLANSFVKRFPLSFVNNRFHRLRHIKDYLDAYENGWLNILADISAIYVNYYQRFGIHAKYVPWGTSSLWYEDLNLERDIGVMWMGKRRTRHRSDLIDHIEKVMQENDIQMFIADGARHPFIYNEKRTEILNRTRITLNLQYIPYIATLPVRFGFTAGNKSLVISEKAPNHSPGINSR